MAYIDVTDIRAGACVSEWLPFRDALTRLDMNRIAQYVNDGQYPEILPVDVLGTGGESPEGLQAISGFLPSSVSSYGLFRPRVVSTHEIQEHPVLLASGIPMVIYSDGVLNKWLVGPNYTRTRVTVDMQDRCLLLPGTDTAREVTLTKLCAVLRGTGVCSIPAILFHRYTGACFRGMRDLYPSWVRAAPHHDNWGDLPREITEEAVMGVRRAGDGFEFTDRLAYITRAVNSTLQDRKTVRELAVEHGIIERV